MERGGEGAGDGERGWRGARSADLLSSSMPSAATEARWSLAFFARLAAFRWASIAFRRVSALATAASARLSAALAPFSAALRRSRSRSRSSSACWVCLICCESWVWSFVIALLTLSQRNSDSASRSNNFSTVWPS